MTKGEKVKFVIDLVFKVTLCGGCPYCDLGKGYMKSDPARLRILGETLVAAGVPPGVYKTFTLEKGFYFVGNIRYGKPSFYAFCTQQKRPDVVGCPPAEEFLEEIASLVGE